MQCGVGGVESNVNLRMEEKTKVRYKAAGLISCNHCLFVNPGIIGCGYMRWDPDLFTTT